MQELQRFRGRGVGLGSYIVCTSFPGVPKTQIIPKFGHQLYNNKYLENTNATVILNRKDGHKITFVLQLIPSPDDYTPPLMLVY